MTFLPMGPMGHITSLQQDLTGEPYVCCAGLCPCGPLGEPQDHPVVTNETYTSMRDLTFWVYLFWILLERVVWFEMFSGFWRYFCIKTDLTDTILFETIPSWRLTLEVPIFLFWKTISHIPIFDQEKNNPVGSTLGLAATPCCAFCGHV